MSEPKKDEVKKRRFIARHISLDTKQLEWDRYAEELERMLNSMHEDGYEPQIMGDPEKGRVLLLGALRPDISEASVSLMELLGGHHRSAHGHTNKSEKTEEVLDFLTSILARDSSFEGFEKNADGAAEVTVKRVGVHEASAVAGDLEDMAKKHSSHHKDPDSTDCDIPQILELFAKKLREKTQANIQ